MGLHQAKLQPADKKNLERNYNTRNDSYLSFGQHPQRCGGNPSYYFKDFIPNYPSRLPGGVHPDLIVPIEMISLALIRNIFMKIEQPEFELQDKLGHVWEYVRCSRSSTMDFQRTDAGEGCSNGDINNYRGHCHNPTDRDHIANYGIRGEP